MRGRTAFREDALHNARVHADYLAHPKMTTPQQPAYRGPNTSQLPAIDRLAFAAVLESPPPLHALANLAEPAGGKLSLSAIETVIIRDGFSDIGSKVEIPGSKSGA